MSPLNLVLGISIGCAALYAGFYCAVKSRSMLAGAWRVHPVIGYAMQLNIGLLVMAVVGILLSMLRIHLGVVPEGADPEFPGTVFGVSTLTFTGILLIAHIALAMLLRKVRVATRRPTDYE